MPHIPTYPTYIENLIYIDLAKYRKAKAFNIGGHDTTAITSFKKPYAPDDKISIRFNNNREHPSATLDYIYNGKEINYTLKIDSVPSNLGKGKVYYFFCPKTGKRARVLYMQNGLFVHRSALKNIMSFRQSLSRKARERDIYLHHYLKLNEYYNEINSKGFKKYYDALPTKRYCRLMKYIRIGESIDHLTVQAWMID